MMANLKISNGMTCVNDGAYTTDLKQMYVGDTFGIRFTLKNTGTKTIKGWGAEMVFFRNSGSEYTRVNAYFDSWGELAPSKSKTITIAGLHVADFGMHSGSYTKKFQISIYGSTDTSHSSAYASVTAVVDDQLEFIGELHNPKIKTFSVARNGNESTQLVLKAYGTRTASSSAHAEKVLFEYKTETDTDWTAVSSADTITVSKLLAGVGISTPKYMAMELPLGTACDFRLTFYNDLGETSQAVRSVGRAFANIHLRGNRDGGVAFGMFCSTGSARFECAYPAYFYGGIHRYNVGDKITIPDGVRLFADITSAKKLIVVPIPVNASGIKAAKVNKFFASICNAGGYGYTSGYKAGGTNYAGLSGVTMYVFPRGELGLIEVQFELSTALGYITNNTPAICRIADAEIEITEVEE